MFEAFEISAHGNVPFVAGAGKPSADICPSLRRSGAPVKR
jgi:hypothetical protein